MDCPACEFPFYSANGKCPKCDFNPKNFREDKTLIVDLCHQRENRREAKIKLISAIEKAQRRRFRRILIIHGYGSSVQVGLSKILFCNILKSIILPLKLRKMGII